MRITITSIEAVIIDITPMDEEGRFMIPFWRVGYEVRYPDDGKIVGNSSTCLTGELTWKHEQVDTDEIVKFIKGLFK